jgi:beta-exotoxin I transport system ATP-binding protein
MTAAPGSTPPSATSATSAIEVCGLTKRYGERDAVVDLDLDVPPGEVFGFLGPNGAGKSTTIRAVVGLQRPTAGTTRVLGFDSWSCSVDVHRRIGYLPGELRLFERMTGRQHLAWCRATRDHGRRSAEPAAARWTTQLVERLDVPMDRPVRHLSKGNRQKVGLLLALAHRPEVLVLDEPTSGLDPLVQDELHRILREAAAGGSTVFLSSHELSEVQELADRVGIIREGRLVVTDTVEHLRAASARTIELTFHEPPDVSLLAAVPGVTVRGAEGPRVTLELRGPVGPLLRVVADLDPVDLSSRRAGLDELFLGYYRDGEVAGVG